MASQRRKQPAKGQKDQHEDASSPPSPLRVEMPAGGHMEVRDADEKAMWEQSAKRFVEDYAITKQNDLVLLGALLSQQLVMFRAQRDLNDESEQKAQVAQNKIMKASGEIREIEKALGIDKKSREKGGQHTVSDYVGRLKRAGHLYGVHIADRVKAYEALASELRWRIRLLRNGDPEDRREHSISEPNIIAWAEQELADLEEKDKAWAKENGALFVGQL